MKAIKNMVFGLGAVCLLLASCDVKEPIHDTPYWDPDKITARTEELPAWTVKLNSFPTSAPAAMPAGAFNDPISGRTTATPYFVPVPTRTPDLTAGCVYDSTTFFARHNHTAWGDTTQLQLFHLYRLQKLPSPDPDDGAIYNNATVVHDPEPLGSYKIWPWPDSLKNFRFRLENNDATGRDLFDKLKSSDPAVLSADRFAEYFKGVVLMPDPGNSSILGFSPEEGGMGITLHYHDGDRTGSYSFTTGHPDFTRLAFLNIVNNAAGTPYAVLEKQSDELPFGDAVSPDAPDGRAFLQGGAGYMVKMELPADPPGYDDDHILIRAEIELHLWHSSITDPFEPSTILYPLPAQVSLYESDADNRILAEITDRKGNPVAGHYVADPTLREDMEELGDDLDKYVIDITDYYNAVRGNSTGGGKIRVLASIPIARMPYNFDWLVIDRLPVLKVSYYPRYE